MRPGALMLRARKTAEWNRSEEQERRFWFLGPSVDLRPPPTNADQQKSPVAEKLGRLAFKGMTDELEYPSDEEKGQPVNPQPMEEDAGNEHCERDENQRYSQCVAYAIRRMLMASGILLNPLFAGATAKHAWMILRLGWPAVSIDWQPCILKAAEGENAIPNQRLFPPLPTW
jgi:hypothetical protein